MEKTTLTVGSFAVNCTVVYSDGKAFVIDPGHEAERIIARLEELKLVPEAILLTHAHFDHINALPGLEERYPGIPVYLDTKDAMMFSHPFNQMPPEYQSIPVPGCLRDVGELDARINVIHTPGHTPGGVSYYFESMKTLFSGDTLFAGSIGRTDFPGGSMNELMESLKRLAALPDDTLVIPGHGMYTTIGREKESNPYMFAS